MSPERAKADLQVLESETRHEGWDGYDARPVTKATIDHVMMLLTRLPEEMSLPSMTADPEGAIQLEWQTAQNDWLLVAVDESGSVHYVGSVGGTVDKGSASLRDGVPEPLIRRITAAA